MYARTPLIVLLFVTAAPAVAAPSSLDSLVAAERAFSATSVEQGMKTAFIQYLADDGIVFRPGPVNGRQSWRTRPNPNGTLIWGPSFAELSGAGDLGFSTGPWEFRRDGQPTAYGHFVSVWRRELGGPWLVVLDHGISHAKPDDDLDHIPFTAGPTHDPPKPDRPRSGLSVGGGVFSGGVGLGVGTTTGGTVRDYEWRRTAHEVNTMMGAERSFGFALRTKGATEAYGTQASDDLRSYRDEKLPSLGKAAAITATGEPRRDRTWLSRGNGVAKSWDLGYSYGIVTERAAKSAPIDTSAYVHLWRKDATGRWKLALDVETPFPKAP